MNIKTWTQDIGTAQKSETFALMLWVNPDLKARFEESPDMFTGFFVSLQAILSSYVREDPHVLGSYIRRMIEEPLHIGGILAEAHQAWRRA